MGKKKVKMNNKDSAKAMFEAFLGSGEQKREKFFLQVLFLALPFVPAIKFGTDTSLEFKKIHTKE